MNYPELLAPAGSMEGVRAAVQNGATAIYMGFGTFNARRGAKNFTAEEMSQAIAYCRARGVKTNITLNVVVFDRELPQALQDAKFLMEAGADALIVQDFGLAAAIRASAPVLELHASTQMTIHNADGAIAAKRLGFGRVVLSRECSLQQITHVKRHVDVETEVFVHGALCMCYSGQCYFSSVVGRRSGNRGLCAQPCRLPYGGAQKYPLSLKDLAAAGFLQELMQAGVSSLKIEGRMKRPEYAAIVTKIYATLLREQRRPTAEEAALLRRVFSRDGFTDGYLTGKTGAEMFGTKTDVPLADVQDLYVQAAKTFAEGKEAPLVPIWMACEVTACGINISIWDADGNHVAMTDADEVETARNHPTTAESLEIALRKVGGTPFAVENVEISLQDGLLVPNSRINALRRELLTQLLQKRKTAPNRTWNQVDLPRKEKKLQPFVGYTIEVSDWEQISPAILQNPPAMLYIPLNLLAKNIQIAQEWIQRGVRLGAVLPRIYSDMERPQLLAELQTIRQAGVDVVYAGNIAHFALVDGMNLQIHGGYGLNVTNSMALEALADLGAVQQTLSFELRLEQVRDMVKKSATELLIYGKLPLMIFENCAILQAAGKHACKKGPYYLTDRKGAKFALLPALGCRNTLFNSTPLFLEREEYNNLGVQYGRILFSDENSQQCDRIWNAIAAGKTPQFATEPTRGLYRRGVE